MSIPETTVNLQAITPILRIFDVKKATEFYVDFLEFHLDWEHKFAADMPLYMQISCDACVIHLSEHHGDCSPGAALRIKTEHIKALHTRLIGKAYTFAKPGLEATPWNTLELQVTDPFGNRIIYFEPLTEEASSGVIAAG
ncbi:glyoxalase superfamily protein [Paenibacillus agricola]|uniref:Bleomycin resistance protein n=1 Tax=Paenibacillus agricola TaxID=2716264 RepID=A0ABX0J5X4_9BACL|nr:glyoxalase superfamily protein [Paenibacillus agricola]NHN31343.1 VOC family protein [Paenibacillus agricola]